jgi:hypothetical protein
MMCRSAHWTLQEAFLNIRQHQKKKSIKCHHSIERKRKRKQNKEMSRNALAVDDPEVAANVEPLLGHLQLPCDHVNDWHGVSTKQHKRAKH